ncbi:MAG: four-carbon acid sugar kinase family protein [Lachnospiraceae bacterium]|nr:four-carbon acid sugar kinase family protein [Lachnospiraceae bacterium]
MEERYLIIADDFTGANDTGVQLKRRGYPTEVLFAGKPVHAQKSIVIDTESRNALPGHAYEIVRHSLDQVDFGQFRYVIKKVDSTMRGNISQEIKAVDDVFHPDLLVFAPALPAQGRTTMDGVQCLNGVEICKTELSKDPKNPVMEDNLVQLLRQVYQERVHLKYLPDVRSDSLSFCEGRIFVCDAESDEDLKRILGAARRDGRKTLYVGTAGMADNLMELEKPTLPSFGVVASISSVANEQMRYCERAGYAMVKVPVAQVMLGAARPEEFLRQTVEYLKKGRDTILLTDTAYDRELIELSQEVGEKKGMDLAEVGDYVRSLIGRIAREVLDAAAVSGVYLTGGDTALGMLLNIGADGSEILDEILVGVPLVRVRGGSFEGMKLVTKAGAFGAEDTAAFAMRKIKERGGQ